MDFLDLADAFNVIDRLDGLGNMIAWADMGYSFHLLHREDACGADIERILKKRGVDIAGRRITSKHVIFIVKQRQARWAEHNILRAGWFIDAVGLVDQSNQGAYERHGGTLPPAWADRPRAKGATPHAKKSHRHHRQLQPQREPDFFDRLCGLLEGAG